MNLKIWILLKPLNFKIDFFGAETTLCTYFTVLENVENPYCSLSLLQQIVGSQKGGPLQPVGGRGGGCDIDIAPVITLVHVLMFIFICFSKVIRSTR